MNPNKPTRQIITAILLVMITIILINTASATVIMQLSDQGTSVKDSAGQTLNTGNLSIEIYNAETGGNLLWNKTYFNAIDNGSWNVMLGEVLELNLTYGEKYWKDYKINNYDLNYTNATGGMIARRAFYSPLGEINKTFIENVSNVFVDVLGDIMTGNLNMSGHNLTNVHTISNAGSSITFTDDLDIFSNVVLNGYNISGISNLIGNSDNIIIGNAGFDSHSLTADDDLFISGKLEVDGLSYFDSNLTVNGDLIVNNGTGGKLFFVNTSGDRVEIWHPQEGANDYVSVYHDGTNAYIKPASGSVYLSHASGDVFWNGNNWAPLAANSEGLGHASYEWRNVYLGEDANSGAYFGLDQDWRLYYNETNLDALVLQNKTGHNIGMISNANTTLYTDKLYVWDDAQGAGDYLMLYHDGSKSVIRGGSGDIHFLRGTATELIIGSNVVTPSSSNDEDLGSGTYEWKSLYMGEDKDSGIYFGLDQDYRLFYNETSADVLQLTGPTNFTIESDVIINGTLYGGSPIKVGDDILVTGTVNATDYIGNGSRLSNIDLTKDLVLNMPFQAGNPLKDYSGYNNDGTSTGAVWNNTGGYNNNGAYEFNAAAHNLSIKDSNSLDLNLSFSIAAWLNINKTGIQCVLAKYSNSGEKSYAWVNVNGELRFLISQDGTATSTVTTTSILNENTWYHMVTTYDGATARIYINGKENNTVSVSYNTIYKSTTPFTIGRCDDAFLFNGTVDEVMLFNRTLSPEEVKRVYEQRQTEPNFDGSPLYLDHNNDRIGINTKTPSHSLTVVGDLNVTGTSYLGDLVIQSENISTTNILPLNADTGVIVRNGSGGKLGFFNTTSGRLEVWHPSEGTGDHLDLYCDTSKCYIDSRNSDLDLRTGGVSYYIANSAQFRPNKANMVTLGIGSHEWKALYLGEDANSGAYFGKDQDWRLYYNETNLDALVLQNKTGHNIGMISNANTTLYTDKLYVWDDAQGAGDYLMLYHDGSKSVIRGGSGDIHFLRGTATELIIGSNVVTPSSSNDEDLGSGTYEWKSLYMGEDKDSGIYFGLDQDYRLFYNETSADVLQLTGPTNFTIESDVIINGTLYGGSPIKVGDDILVTGTVNATDYIGNGSRLSNIDLTKDLVLNMPFQAGNPLKDYSGYNNDGTSTGAVWNNTGGYNNNGAYEFNAASHNLSIKDSNSLDLNLSFSIAAWLKINKTGVQCVLGKYSNAGEKSYAFVNVNGQLSFIISSDGTATNTVATTSNLNENKWYHMAATYDGATGLLYINGKENNSASISYNSLYKSTVPFTIGRCTDAFLFNGTIDEVMLFNRTLSPEEVKRVYEQRQTEPNFDGSPLYLDHNNDRIGINTKTPSHSLTVVGDLNVTGTSYLGDLVIQSENISTTNILPLDADTGVTIRNGSGGKLVFANTTSGRLEVWHAEEGASDYVEIYHSGTDGFIKSQAGILQLDSTDGIIQARNTVRPLTNALNLGTTSNEWGTLFLGEDSDTGVFFGLDQDYRIFYNETSADVLQLTGPTNFTIESDVIINGTLYGGSPIEIGDDVQILGNLNVTGTSYLGDLVIQSENISTTNILPLNADTGVIVRNGSGGKLGVFNTTKGRLEIWSPAEGANDWVSIEHDGTYGYVDTGSGGIKYGAGGVSEWQLSTNVFLPEGANINAMGSTTAELKSIYLGEDAYSGAYFGLDQDSRIWYNSTNRTLFLDSLKSNVSVVTPTFRIFDDARADDDYAELYHNAANAVLNTGSGTILLNVAGSTMAYVNTAGIMSGTANGNDLGSTSQEWRRVYTSEGVNSGVYFGMGQEYQTMYDTTTGLNTTGSLNYTLNSDVKITGKLYGGSPLEIGSNVTIDGSLNVTGTSYLGDLVIDSDNITVANLIGRGGDNIRIGDAAADTHSLAADDDLFISGKLEVDGTSYFDGGTVFASSANTIQDNMQFLFGSNNDATLDWSTAQATENTVVWGLGDTAKSIIFTTNTNDGTDHDHPAQSNPTIFMHSDEDPDADNTKWGAISHDNDSMTIDSGTDEIMLKDETFVQGNLTIGDDEIGVTQGMFYHNGTVSIIQMMSPDETMWNCWVNNTGGWMCE